MARRDKSITAICGGRAAIVPADAADDDSLSDGAYRLFAKLCGHAKPDGSCELNVKAYAALRGVSPRSVQKWKRELELAGRLVQLHEGDPANGRYRVVRDRKERLGAAAANRAKVDARGAAKTTRANKAKADDRAQLEAPANLSSHPRCERQFALLTGVLTEPPPLPSPATASAGRRNHHARQGNQAGGQSEPQGHLRWPPHQVASGEPDRPGQDYAALWRAKRNVLWKAVGADKHKAWLNPLTPLKPGPGDMAGPYQLAAPSPAIKGHVERYMLRTIERCLGRKVRLVVAAAPADRAARRSA